MVRPGNSHLHSHLPLLLILCLGLVLRLGLLVGTWDMGLKIVDEQHYQQLASSLFHGDGFAWGPNQPTSIRPPLYPGFVALVWWITGGENLLAVRLVQVILSLTTAVLLYVLALHLFNRHVATLCAALFTFYPELLGFNFLLLTETLFTFWMVLFALLFVLLMQSGGRWYAVSAGLILGLGAMTRSVLWPFPAVGIPLILWFVPQPLTGRIRLAVLFFLGYALVVAPWAVRNTALQGTVTIIDTMGGITLRMGNYEYTPEDRAWDPRTLEGEYSVFQDLYREHPGVTSWTEGQKDKWAQRKAVQYMLSHPSDTLRRAAIKFANFWGLERNFLAAWQQGLYHPPVWLAGAGVILIPVIYAAILLLASLGVFWCAPPTRGAHILFLFLIAFLTAVHSLAFGHSRYHLPLVPFLCLYAAAALASASWVHLRQGMRQAAVPIGICLLWIGIWSREVFVVEADRIRNLLTALLG